MLDAAIASQLSSHLEKVTVPIALVASLDDGPKSIELLELLTEVAAMSPRITVERSDDDDRRPSFAIQRVGTDIGVRFAGIPLGHEFTSFVLALLQVGGHKPAVSDEILNQIRELDGDYHFETYFSLTCQNCPDVVQALNLMSVVNPRIHHVAIDGALFPEEVADSEVLAVPTVFLNGAPFDQGRMSLEQIVAKLDTGAPEKAARRLAAMDPFEVLVVGGGPAGTAAAVYAARKGIRTGIATERFGGQLLDTMAIENFVSVPYTEGPTLATAMEQHALAYDVEVMTPHIATGLRPADADGMVVVEFDSGATLRARTVVLSPGARWRSMNVPGEAEYRNKGVTYCPHCDGPLFKGKRVAVIGGGNSGVEAAIDLAGVVAHVTLIEFDDALRADEVLVAKVRSLSNVDVILSALTTEVHGNGSKVTSLDYQDRETGSHHQLELEGVFVQIGLLPNTEWLAGSIKLSEHGEIVIDDRGHTSMAGVFAAGDATTVPFKQIVIALGAGAIAALSAFDHLIRTPEPEVHSAEASGGRGAAGAAVATV